MTMLASNKLYQSMSLKEYNTAKQTCIKRLNQGYETKSVPEKWDLLLELFKNLAPQYSEKLTSFQLARKNTNYNLFNLSLTDCLQYFENFYFLYTTSDPQFKLSDSQKSLLLEAIDDAMGTCETGISTRFEGVLQQYRTDLDWITNVLSKSRYQLLLGLQDAYNTTYHIALDLRVHVLKIMTQLATDAGLGIEIEHYIKDAFASLVNKTQITQYFQEHAPRVFTEDYEEVVVDILSQHLLFELQELFCPNATNWENETSLIPATRVQEFMTFVNNRLGLTDISPIESLGELEDDNAYCLKNKKETYALLRAFVQKKLIQDQYVIPFTAITKENASIARTIQLKKGVSFSTLLKINETLLNYSEDNTDEIATLLQKNSPTLLHYPDLLLSHIDAHPDLLELLPRALETNSYFQQQTAEAIDKAMCLAISTGSLTQIDTFTPPLLRLIKQNPHLVSALSKPLLSYEPFALSLVAIDGLLIKFLPETLRDNPGIAQAAIRQTPFAVLYTSEQILRSIPTQDGRKLNAALDSTQKTYIALQQHLKTIYRLDFPECPIGDDDGWAHPEKGEMLLSSLRTMKAVHALLTAKSLGALSVAHSTKIVSPELLIKIVNIRKENHLSPLPHCADIAIIEDFCNALAKHGMTDWSEGFASIKRQACELTRYYTAQHNPYEKTVVGYLVKADDWYTAMQQYHNSMFGPINTLEKFWLQLKRTMQSYALLAKNLFQFAVIGAAGWYVGGLAWALFASLSLSLVLGLCALALFGPTLAKSINNRRLMAVASVASALIFAILLSNFIIYTLATIYCIKKLVQTPALFKAAFQSTVTLFSRLLKSLFSWDAPSEQLSSGANIKIKCEESIARLKCLDEPSAQAKADLLETLWNKITAAIHAETSEGLILPERADIELAKRLRVPQELTFQGKTHTLSFYDIAAIRRKDATTFQVPTVAVPATHGFFKPTTLKQLPEILENKSSILSI